MNTFINAFSFIVSHRHLISTELVVYMDMVAQSMIISLLIGIPIGVLLGHIHRLSFLAINISNVGRSLPSLAVLSILLPIIGIGRTDVIIALVILAIPPILTNSYVAIDQIDSDIVEAAQGMGMKPWQVILKIELPLALPLIFAGIRTSMVFVIATATLAGFFGGGGLGDIIANESAYGLDGVIGASYILIILSFVSQAIFIGLEWLMTPTGLKQQNLDKRQKFSFAKTKLSP